MTSIHDLLDEYARTATDTRTKGFFFERLIREFIASDPLYSSLYDEVWLWQDWPGRDGKADTGIDLVARDKFTGGYCAIQCKFYAPSTYISKEHIDSFFTASGKHPFTSRLIVATTSRWSANATAAIENQQIPTAKLGLNELEQSDIDWSKYSFTDPGSLAAAEPKKLRTHQIEALGDVVSGLDAHDRGRLIMACGTGKTFTSLRIAERLVEPGGSVLFLVPSIALLAQSLREWASQSNRPLRAFAVCSDVAVGRNPEDYTTADLAIPATTNTERLLLEVNQGSNGEGLTVYFSTYHSLAVLHGAQESGLPTFDLVICDEAHRTTGITGENESHFVKIHDPDYIRAHKRLYMTATPKIFGEAVKAKARDAAVELASMDDEARFGPELHRLGFGEAVTRDLLTDYKVLVLAVKEEAVSSTFQQTWAQNAELQTDDAAKIVGIYKALAKQGVEGLAENDSAPMRRAVAFSRSIKDSQRVTDLLNESRAGVGSFLTGDDPLLIESDHVDGSMNAMIRTAKLDWLKAEPAGNFARILTNARCLSEGVDVPSLDAVIFLNSRDSQVDVVQSVGRVMRKLEGKHYGYIILPVVIPAGVEPSAALDDNKKYKIVWEVLRALRAHDERFEARIDSFELNRSKHDDQVQIIGVENLTPSAERGDGVAQVPLDFTPLGPEWTDAIYAKILQKVGKREYWENWATDVADVARTQTLRIESLVRDSPDAGVAFQRFVKGLRDNLNPGISESDAMEMLSQHLITQPVLEALFEGFSFLKSNPVARVMQEMLDSLEGTHVEADRDGLAKFYESVRARVRQITDARGKQEFLKLLYQRFFSVAMKKASDRFGIVYTPTEIVDFILRSADEVMKTEFGRGLGDRDVNILDPFSGTGTFLVRLMQLPELISDAQLPHKYRNELHANEISLLAYYVAAANIEEAYHQRMGGNYVPFDNLLLTDTFQMTEDGDELDAEGVFADNNAAIEMQMATPMNVIIGNPPYAKGQASGNDDNQNHSYPTLDRRIQETYAARSTAQNKNNLYDAYIRSIRWASDRIGDEGVVAFVSNGGFIDGNTADGLRKTLAEEFSSLYIYNLRGNTRTSGEQALKEGGQTFGPGSRATIAISVLVKNPGLGYRTNLRYFQVPDYQSRPEKLSNLVAHRSAFGVSWSEIDPNESGDWINARTETFQAFQPIGAKGSRGGRSISAFTTYSRGLSTGRDAWIYSFSRATVNKHVTAMTAFFNSQVDSRSESNLSGSPWRRDLDPTKFSWNGLDEKNLNHSKKIELPSPRVVPSMYRPFNKQWACVDRSVNDSVYRLEEMFPSSIRSNPGIYNAGAGSAVPFAAVMLEDIPNLHVTGAGSGGQYFPRYRYEKNDVDPNQLGGFDGGDEWTRVDNVTDEILADYRATYSDADVTKDDIFFYLYGLLHSPEYRERFAADLKKMLPRIPKVTDFATFRDSGRKLAQLHMEYESVTQYPLEIETKDDASLLVTKMKFAGTRPNIDKSTIVYNDAITIRGIPDAAHDYKLGSRSALEWVLERYQVKKDKPSGIVNDPNDWGLEHDNPRYILDLIGSIVTVSVETVRIVSSLPPLDIIGEVAVEAEEAEEAEEAG